MIKGCWRASPLTFDGAALPDRRPRRAGPARCSDPTRRSCRAARAERVLTLAAREADIVGLNVNLRAGHLGPEMGHERDPRRDRGRRSRLIAARPPAGRAHPSIQVYVHVVAIGGAPARASRPGPRSLGRDAGRGGRVAPRARRQCRRDRRGARGTPRAGSASRTSASAPSRWTRWLRSSPAWPGIDRASTAVSKVVDRTNRAAADGGRREAEPSVSDFPYWMISVDDHVLEPAHLWQERVPAKLRDRAPKLVGTDGGTVWEFDGQPPADERARGRGRARRQGHAERARLRRAEPGVLRAEGARRGHGPTTTCSRRCASRRCRGSAASCSRCTTTRSSGSRASARTTTGCSRSGAAPCPAGSCR